MMIAFDNAPVAPKPVRWQMNRILTLATIPGIPGVVSSFIRLRVAREYFYLDTGIIQTLIFLKHAITGHMTIYLARTGSSISGNARPPRLIFLVQQKLRRQLRPSSRSIGFS
jgi:H+-transporting ATPase